MNEDQMSLDNKLVKKKNENEENQIQIKSFLLIFIEKLKNNFLLPHNTFFEWEIIWNSHKLIGRFK
jgi:hypothetical protein